MLDQRRGRRGYGLREPRYGRRSERRRIVRDVEGGFSRIVEQKDATPEQLLIDEVNPSYYVFKADELFSRLSRLKNDNANGEYYITDDWVIEELVRAALTMCMLQLHTHNILIDYLLNMLLVMPFNSMALLLACACATRDVWRWAVSDARERAAATGRQSAAKAARTHEHRARGLGGADLRHRLRRQISAERPAPYLHGVRGRVSSAVCRTAPV